jgi:predicted phage-related endonuclease
MDLTEQRAHIDVMKACKQRIAELESMYDLARATVQEAMGDDEIGQVNGTVVLTWKTIKTRRLNTQWLKQKFPDIREECMETTEYRRLELK